MKWNVYILECSDGSFYIGMTNNLNRRVQEHQSGVGSRYAKILGPVKLCYSESYELRKDAADREKVLKKYPRERKKKLIAFGLGTKY